MESVGNPLKEKTKLVTDVSVQIQSNMVKTNSSGPGIFACLTGERVTFFTKTDQILLDVKKVIMI